MTGTLQVIRDARLIAKAEHAAAQNPGPPGAARADRPDALTGLGNRRRLSSDLAAALERATTGRPALLLLFELGFKAYSDTFGHLAGDQLLTRLGAKLTATVGPDGGAYRLGGTNSAPCWISTTTASSTS